MKHNKSAPRTGGTTIDMLSGSLADKILIFAFPLALSSILQQVFNSADIAVVGRFTGNEALAAVSSNSALINIIINMFVGLSVGANVVVASLIGQNRADRVETAVHTTMMLSIISGIFLTVLGLLVSHPILVAINTPDNVLPLATLYLRIYFFAMPAMTIYNFGASVLRAKGDSRRPLYALFTAGVLNVILNLVFVVGFSMGVAGVAIATVISNCVSAVMIWIYLMREEPPLRLVPRRLRLDGQTLIRIAKIGVPSGVQGMVFSFSNILIQGAINSLGSNAMAGNGAAMNFEYFSYFMVTAFVQAATTFTSQNFGAGNVARCKRIFILCEIMGFLSSGILSAIFVIFRNYVIRVYTVDPDVIQYANVRMLLAVGLVFITTSYEVAGGALRAMGHSMLPAVGTLFGSCILRIVWVLTVFKLHPTFETVIACYPITWTLTGIAIVSAYFVIRRKAFAAIESGKKPEVV